MIEKQRTVELFSPPVDELANKLTGREIISSMTGLLMRIEEVKPWSRNENMSKQYRPMLGMTIGTVFTPKHRQGVLFLIVSHDSDGSGACVQVTEASFFDPDSGDFVASFGKGDNARQKDIVELMGLAEGETGKLSFKDSSDVLFVEAQG